MNITQNTFNNNVDTSGSSGEVANFTLRGASLRSKIS